MHKLRLDSHACSLQNVSVHEENTCTIVKVARQVSHLGLVLALSFFKGTKIHKHQEGFPFEIPSNAIDKAMAKNYAREEHDQVFIQLTHLNFHTQWSDCFFNLPHPWLLVHQTPRFRAFLQPFATKSANCEDTSNGVFPKAWELGEVEV